jgi:hypothetical protein
MMALEDNMIMDVESNRTEDGKIRLKYLAISGGCGPEFKMDEDLARKTIEQLRKALA